jgi:hypothetical protein
VADVWEAVRVVDRRSEIKLGFALGHWSFWSWVPVLNLDAAVAG